MCIDLFLQVFILIWIYFNVVVSQFINLFLALLGIWCSKSLAFDLYFDLKYCTSMVILITMQVCSAKELFYIFYASFFICIVNDTKENDWKISASLSNTIFRQGDRIASPMLILSSSSSSAAVRRPQLDIYMNFVGITLVSSPPDSLLFPYIIVDQSYNPASVPL